MKTPDMLKAKMRITKETVIKTEEYILKENLKTLGINKKYYVRTYGCQMNEHDSENIKAILEEMSFTESETMENADFILLNTCAIRENAHNKVFGFLGRVKHLKDLNPNIICGICGCMAQEEVIVDEIKNKYKWVDLVFGTHNIYNLPNLLNEIITNKNREIEVMSIEGEVIENIPVKRDSKYKAWVNIMYGCDKFCTYSDNYYMENLLEDTAKTGIERVRFITSHPWDFTDKMIDVIAKYDNIMPYIHLPLQSGSNNILKLMGRRYTKESYLELVHKMKEKIPNLSLTTDIIVGFPGETLEDFNETLKVVDECEYDSAFTFIFSPRVGTPAALMKDDVTLEEKNKRLHILNEKVNEYALKNNKKYLNKTVKVLLEGPSEKEDNLMGYTDTMKLVNVKADKKYLGKIVNVKINDVKTWSMDGSIEGDE